MNSDEINFLLRYAKEGVLKAMVGLDEIAADELKHEYIRIKRSLLQPSSGSVSSDPVAGVQTPKKEEEKPSGFRKWVSGIKGRQNAYKEKHKGDII